MEVYPKVLHVGDPLYVRIHFHNTTNTDAYAIVFDPSVTIDRGNVEFYLREHTGRFIPWRASNGFNDAARRSVTVWQKVKPGENGPTMYVPLGFPGISYSDMWSFYSNGYDKKRWEEIKGLPHAMNRKKDEMRQRVITNLDAMSKRGEIDREISREIYDVLERVPSGVSGHLMVFVNNWSFDGVENNINLDPIRYTSLVEGSEPILIKPRNQKEMEILGWSMPFFDGEHPNRQDLERIIPELAPGTLYNLFKYNLLLMELKEYVESTEKLNEVESEIFESFEKIEKLLKTLHTIECENLKRIAEDRWYFEERMENNEKLLTRLNEVLGKVSVPERILDAEENMEYHPK